jgi:hypothetical protein
LEHLRRNGGKISIRADKLRGVPAKKSEKEAQTVNKRGCGGWRG